MAKAPVWNVPILLGLLAAFLGTLAMWWLYFGTASKDAIATITQSGDPGRIGAYFHYVHAILVAGIIATAVGNDLVLAQPHDAPSVAYILALSGGPAIYLLGSAIYKKIVYDTIPVSHIAGAVALAAIAPVAFSMDLLQAGLATTVVMLAVCIWEDITVHRRRKATAPLA